MEAHFKTEAKAGLIIGGIPDVKNETVRYAIKIPGALSFLAHGDFSTPVTGLDAFPKDSRPPVAITHYAFQTMVAIGMLMLLIAVFYFFTLWKRKNGWRNGGC